MATFKLQIHLKVHKSRVLPAKMQAVLGLEDFFKIMDLALRRITF